MAENKTAAQMKKEIEELKAMLAESQQKASTKNSISVAANEAYMNEPVTIKLFKDNDKYKDDVYVSVNDRSYLIKRGVEVSVPRFVEQALKNSLSQDEYVASLVERLVNDYEKSVSRF